MRIRSADGRIVGAGFLVGERHILTCAHVISQALGLPDHLLDLPQGAVSLDYPLVAPHILLEALVGQWESRRYPMDVGTLPAWNCPATRQREQRSCVSQELRMCGTMTSVCSAFPQATMIACSLPRYHGIPLTHWSRAELTRHVAATPGLPEISSRTIGRWLTAEQIRPWRFHSWQHIQEPETFLQRARPVLWLYEHALSLLQEGIWRSCAARGACRHCLAACKASGYCLR